MSVLFGWIIFAIGVLEIILAASNRRYITGRGWMLAGGIIEAIIGLILIFNVALSAATMPIVLGFWLLFRGFSRHRPGRRHARPCASAARAGRLSPACCC